MELALTNGGCHEPIEAIDEGTGKGSADTDPKRDAIRKGGEG
jgi:hypothetical protein